MEKLAFPKEIVVTTNKGVKYLLETLEPEGIDSFSIGIFSIRCYSKEGYSELCFEDTAAQILKDNLKLKEALQQKNSGPHFSKSPEAQLEWVYKHSVYYESAFAISIYRVL
jgi:hypothetical protein